jgi:hypothetical protein
LQDPLKPATQNSKISRKSLIHNYFEDWNFWLPLPIAHCSMLSREPKPPANSSSTTEPPRPASLSATSSSSPFPVAHCLVVPSADLFSPSPSTTAAAAVAGGTRSGRTTAAERRTASRWRRSGRFERTHAFAMAVTASERSRVRERAGTEYGREGNGVVDENFEIRRVLPAFIGSRNYNCEWARQFGVRAPPIGRVTSRPAGTRPPGYFSRQIHAFRLDGRESRPPYPLGSVNTGPQQTRAQSVCPLKEPAASRDVAHGRHAAATLLSRSLALSRFQRCSHGNSNP